jgi:hypothetical protein
MTGGIIEWEHRAGEEFILRFKPPLGRVVTDEAKGHIRAARKEILLALRSLVDAAIARIEESKKASPTKIEVE